MVYLRIAGENDKSILDNRLQKQRFVIYIKRPWIRKIKQKNAFSDNYPLRGSLTVRGVRLVVDYLSTDYLSRREKNNLAIIIGGIDDQWLRS